MFADAKKLGTLLLQHRLTLAVAESCTGGMLGAAITSIPGSSAYFKGGVIAYSNEIKEKVLGVPVSLLETKGAVSAEVAEAMAEGAIKLCGSSCGIAVSGIAGPDGGSADKPVGLVCIGICLREQVRSFEFRFTGDREGIRKEATKAGLRKMVERLKAGNRL
ncbi:MAG: CinA family protein [Chitinivibrionales bacterium]